MGTKKTAGTGEKNIACARRLLLTFARQRKTKLFKEYLRMQVKLGYVNCRCVVRTLLLAKQ